jgi:drug/metabolite transporter (DMT)-like permease
VGNKELALAAVGRSFFVATSVWLVNYAYSVGGTLAMVQIIYSMYILITVLLAIILYKEHWNLQKIAAIFLSVLSLALLS